jgi:hypothetical protein
MKSIYCKKINLAVDYLSRKNFCYQLLVKEEVLKADYIRHASSALLFAGLAQLVRAYALLDKLS